MVENVGEHLGTMIGTRRVILSETLVLREGDTEVTAAVQGVAHVTFRFVEKPGKEVDVKVELEDENRVIVKIDDGQERGGFTSWAGFINDGPGGNLVIALFVDPIGVEKRTRQFSFTLSLGPE